ncbi:ABC transporter substrate-binding protein [Afifella marina]|uniref:Polar amino acid transport system substrate-binding protein n=1 Tax=Afifella marina DSM 2698 TaxID=1120955 RepID=A0A1G5MKB8_AFIMA|nr:ABC transporter substrate-binding protein [Afifella marina]MBK1623848.1 amino acid ABC transporter [Afifella marina DSM 2698]MBK1627236.1 amino acid ABC transporter [Afifella marina]MBK5918735.1 amino acid ABC transporter [Afifella marina]RAI22654.1 amino acid ABC transporter [Afifella marina DSM 2698]SCZ25657.1 polar amino acid transport system substrate-binding protein [Afifella marina DSM 2698]
MSLFKKLAAATVLAVLATGAAQAQETLRIGTEGAYPPFSEITADGKLVGFDIDIANALCDEMKVKCEFISQDWDGIIPALLAGKYDAIVASMSITEERKEKVDFTDKYYDTPQAIVVPKDSDITEATAESMADRSVGAQSSTTHAQYAEQIFPDSDIRLYPSADEYKLDLSSGRLDAALDDVIVLSEWVDSEDGSCCKILTTLPGDPKIYGPGIGIAVRKGDDELREKLNAAIKAIRENGTYKKINDKYFDFDVYGG